MGVSLNKGLCAEADFLYLPALSICGEICGFPPAAIYEMLRREMFFDVKG